MAIIETFICNNNEVYHFAKEVYAKQANDIATLIGLGLLFPNWDGVDSTVMVFQDGKLVYEHEEKWGQELLEYLKENRSLSLEENLFIDDSVHYNVIKITDYTDKPGARLGPGSGYNFRVQYIEPALKDAVNNNYVVDVDLDGVVGYASSFLDEAFGALIGEYNAATILTHLRFKCNDEPSLEEEIKRYINEREKWS